MTSSPSSSSAAFWLTFSFCCNFCNNRLWVGLIFRIPPTRKVVPVSGSGWWLLLLLWNNELAVAALRKAKLAVDMAKRWSSMTCAAPDKVAKARWDRTAGCVMGTMMGCSNDGNVRTIMVAAVSSSSFGSRSGGGVAKVNNTWCPVMRSGTPTYRVDRTGGGTGALGGGGGGGTTDPAAAACCCCCLRYCASNFWYWTNFLR